MVLHRYPQWLCMSSFIAAENWLIGLKAGQIQGTAHCIRQTHIEKKICYVLAQSSTIYKFISSVIKYEGRQR